MISSAQDSGQMRKPAKTHARATHGVHDFIARITLDKAPERNLPLKPRQTHANAGVGATGKGKMAIRLSCNIKPLGFDKLQWVAIGGANAQGDSAPWCKLYVTQVRFLSRDSIAQLIRALKAQHFFDAGFD